MSSVASSNTFLAALPERARSRIVELGSVVNVHAGLVLHESGAQIRDAWFPMGCVSSISATMQDGTEAEVAIIGNEGLVGVTAVLGGSDITWNEAAVQIGGDILRVPIHLLIEETSRSALLRLLLQRYSQAVLVQAAQTAACNRFHSIEQRLGRALLAFHDRVQDDDILITQERLAGLLGSLRPGVTIAAQHLQDRKIIHYSRGRIHVDDRRRLAEVACECYDAVAAEYDRLLGSAAIARIVAAGVEDEMLREMNSQLLIAGLREQQAREETERSLKAALEQIRRSEEEKNPKKK